MKARSSFFAIAFLVCLILAGFISGYASSSPDGLEKAVAELKIEEGEEQAWTHSPLPDYSVSAVDNERLSTGLSGILGTALVFALGYGLAVFARKKEPAPKLEKVSGSA